MMKKKKNIYNTNDGIRRFSVGRSDVRFIVFQQNNGKSWLEYPN